MTLKSMTAFGSGEHSSETNFYRCEIKTLNSRFCDISIKLPRSLMALEPPLLNLIKSRLQRGKVDVFVEFSAKDKKTSLPRLNLEAVTYYKQLALDLTGMEGSLSAYELLRLDGVLEGSSGNPTDVAVTTHQGGIQLDIEAALQNLIRQRESEGAALQTALSKMLDGIRDDRLAIDSRREVIQAKLYENYRKRLHKLLSNLEENGQKIGSMPPEDRLLSEVAVLTDRSDIEEELTRLEAHENAFRKLMDDEEDAGRKMDFLCQEMHREVNTVSNKLMQMEVASHSLSLKQGIERLRQQVQNIE